MEYLSAKDIEQIFRVFADVIFKNYDAPMPPFEHHDTSKLDAILKAPQQTFGGKELYPKLEQKAATLYYGLNKGHAFENGNKRIATGALLVFLLRQGWYLDCEHNELFAMAIHTAESSAQDHEQILKEIEQWIVLKIKIVPDFSKILDIL